MPTPTPDAPGPLVCRDAVELVTEYLEAALDPSRASAFERHVAGCDGCAAYVAQIRTTIRVVRSVGAARDAAVGPRAAAAWEVGRPPPEAGG